MKVAEQLREMWRQATQPAGRVGVAASANGAEAERRTLAMPSILSPVQFPGRLLPKPTPMNLRRFAETPVVRRAINVIKDRVAAMDWQVRVRRGVNGVDSADAARRLTALRRVDVYKRQECNVAGSCGLSHAGVGSGEPVLAGQCEPNRHDAGRDRELHGRNFL